MARHAQLEVAVLQVEIAEMLGGLDELEDRFEVGRRDLRVAHGALCSFVGLWVSLRWTSRRTRSRPCGCRRVPACGDARASRRDPRSATTRCSPSPSAAP